MIINRPIFLTGFMGSGKSTIGPKLAHALSCPFMDLDQQIVNETGRSINEVFETEGEAYFRNLEQQHLKKIPIGLCVVSTGGGVVISPENRNFMHKNGIIINLVVNIEQLLLRLNLSNGRPLLAGENVAERATKLLAERELYYADADIRIDTNGKSVEDVLAEILHSLKENSL